MMHPLSAVLIYSLLPDGLFTESLRRRAAL
jgi:hypothetical protein